MPQIDRASSAASASRSRCRRVATIWVSGLFPIIRASRPSATLVRTDIALHTSIR